MAKRVDANQKKIVQQLRKLGCSVSVTSMIGKGFPDFVIGMRGKNYLIELKDGSKPPSQRKLTPDEVKFHALWRGQIAVCNNINEIIKLIGL
jgi:hypothetical protein